MKQRTWWKSRLYRTFLALLKMLVTLAIFGGALGIFFVVLWKVPEFQVAKVQGISADKSFELENAARTTLAQILAGGFFLITAYFTWRSVSAAEKTVAVSRETLAVSEQGQITDRFTKAIEQLGDSSSVTKRIGGIYALERIARDSERDHWPIMQVLTAYVREHCPWNDGDNNDDKGIVHPSADINAIIRVISHRSRTYLDGEQHPLNLRGLDLRGADFYFAHLEGVRMDKTHLEGASFRKAQLVGARLRRTFLNNANLSGANLTNADLSKATLRGADLQGATLSKTILRGADLTETIGLTKEQLVDVFLDEKTCFPKHLQSITEVLVHLETTK